MEASARIQPAAAGPVYTRRQREKTALYQALQQHLLTFEQQLTDAASGRTLPKFVTEELHKYLDCGMLGHAQLRLIALIKSEDIAKKILTAMHLPATVPALHPAHPPPKEPGGGDDRAN